MFRVLRRAYQLFFFSLFLYLVIVTTGSLLGGWPVWWFLAFDPLHNLATTLATQRTYVLLLWSLPLFVLTLIVGRFFCGWICPMGVLHQLVGYLFAPRRASVRIERNQPRRLFHIKYLILLFMLGAALMGSTQVGLLDPIALTWRALSTSIVPALSNLALGLYQGERHFHFSTLISLLFVAALVANVYMQRLYCRLLCPLGALLGLLSKFSLFRLRRDLGTCNNCKLCAADCQGAADPQGTLLATECMLCLNCVEDCPQGSLRLSFMPATSTTTDRIDLGRRRWVSAALAGVASVPLVRASDGSEPRPDPRRIRPPGALPEKDFLARCIKCGACMKVCPTSALQPALAESGIEGLWSPILVPRHGHCEQQCILCSQVCPTGAIRPISLAEKLGQPPHESGISIGTAFFNRGRCLPWAMDTQCIVCEEVCPTSPKAIHLKKVTVTRRDGQSVELKRPRIDPALCWGCGICEARCPVFDEAAVRVSSVGESRDPKNRIILGRDRREPPA